MVGIVVFRRFGARMHLNVVIPANTVSDIFDHPTDPLRQRRKLGTAKEHQDGDNNDDNLESAKHTLFLLCLAIECYPFCTGDLKSDYAFFS